MAKTAENTEIKPSGTAEKQNRTVQAVASTTKLNNRPKI